MAEILLLDIYQMVAWKCGNRGCASMIFISAGSFVSMAVGTMWVTRKTASRLILLGFHDGAVAEFYYVVRSLPDLHGGIYPDYVQLALAGHIPKFQGGFGGGFWPEEKGDL